MKQVKQKKVPSEPITNFRHVINISLYLEETSKKYGYRDKILFQIGCTTGYRTGDLVELTVQDVRDALSVGYFMIYENKPSKNKNIPEKRKEAREAEIIPELEVELKKYIKDKAGYEYMFPSNKKNSTKPHITVETISKRIKEAALYFRLKNITAHSMRKTYAWDQYLESEYDIVYVSELLGHKDIEYTKWYLRIGQEKRKKLSKSLGKFIRA